MIIYENTIVNFKKAIEEKRLIPLLLDAYKGKDNKTLSLIKAKLKLTMSELWFLFFNQNINDDCGVRIDMFLSLDQIRICLILTSTNNDKHYVTCMNLYSYESVKSSNSEDMIFAYDGFSNEEKLLIHPSYQSLSYQNYISKQIDDGKTIFNSFSYLYDCVLSEDSDIEDKEKYPYEEKAPIIYARDYNTIYKLIKDTISYGNGEKALKELKQRAKHYIDGKLDKLLDEQKYVVNQVSLDLKENINTWYFIDGDYKSARIIADYCKSEGKKQNKEISIFYDLDDLNISCVNKESVSIFIYSKLRNDEQFTNLVELAKENNIQIREYTLTFNITMSDDGRGLDFLSRKLQLQESESNAKWNPYNFEIRIVDNENEFLDNKDYANIVIKNSISYNSETNKVEGSDEEKRALLKALSNGSSGVCILCEDENLQNYMKKEVKDAIAFAKNATEIVKNIYESKAYDKHDLNMQDFISTKAEKRLIESLGKENWDKMDKDSKLSLNSAIIAYRNLKEFNQLADFSGICLQVCKAVEVEMIKRYFSEYIVFLKNKYGDQALEKANYDLLKKTKNPKDPKEFADAKTQTIGSLPYIAGLYPGRGISNKYAWNEFKDYAEKVLLKDPSDSLNTIGEHLKYTNSIKNKYRNKSAHKETMDVTEAFECIDYVIGLYRKLGIMLDAYKI